MRLYVGNLAYSTTDERLAEVFGQHGDVTDAKVIVDRDTGRSKGFGFVEMPDDNQANEAIRALDGAEVDGRSLRVNEAMPQERRGGPRF
ncbi:MAG: RNA-binding protein [Coriobacteriia bacterium]|nr:RNA-binding protein [Coriobacteriia bacterium]